MFLKTLIGDRRLVQLGESDSGAAEFIRIKTRMVKFLHEEMGFDVLAFETGLFDAYQAYRDIGSSNPTELMKRGLGPDSWTGEILELFEYLLSTQSTTRPLKLSGYDAAPQTPSGRLARPPFLGTVISRVDGSLGDKAAMLDEEMVQLFSAYRWFDSVAARGDELRGRLLEITSFFEDHQAELENLFPHEDPAPLVAERTLRNNLIQIERAEQWYFWCGATELRDQAMADNLSLLLDEIFVGDKVIAWGSNLHLRHANARVQSGTPCETMGEVMEDRYRDQLYTIGLYMYGGVTKSHGGSTTTIAPAPDGSLEAYLHQAGESIFFLDLLHQDTLTSPPWIFEPIPSRAGGKILEGMVHADQYDAILQVDRVRPATYMH
jgi:erythromycin esterase